MQIWFFREGLCLLIKHMFLFFSVEFLVVISYANCVIIVYILDTLFFPSFYVRAVPTVSPSLKNKECLRSEVNDGRGLSLIACFPSNSDVSCG
jgi:hypothetical protein